jgi:hypothetical protein
VSLAVVTLTNAARRSVPTYAEYLSSVRAALPAGARHVEVECAEPRFLERVRVETLALADWVCWVDDDAVVDNGSLARCWEIASTERVGCVFTDEEYVSHDGSPAGGNLGRKVTYRDIASSPQTVHHLAMFRTRDVDAEALRAGQAAGIGVEWMVKASAALNAGAVHVPGYGYRWRQHRGSVSKAPAFRNAYGAGVHLLQCYLLPRAVGLGAVERAEGTLGA